MRTTIAFPSSLFALALALPAQTWTESADAGDLPSTAQVPAGTIVDLASITGTLNGTTDVDMFLIDIADAVAFTATTVGGATFDTQLWLFHPDGRGVAFNDDTASAQSSLSGALVPHPGRYLIAISAYNRDALAHGGLMWNNSPFLGERRPDGGRRGEAVDGWTGSGGGGAYTIGLTGCKRPGKLIVLPDNHHLSESSVVSPSGSTAWWRGTGGRFQVIYDASHFLGTGVGVGWLDRLLFRGEDGENNAGGQQWANVTVRLGRTTMTPATLGTDFAANLAACSSLSPVATFPTVTVTRSDGSFPNNPNIALDLFATIGGYYYEATLGNLLVDVTMPTAAVPTATSGAVMPMQDTSGSAAFVRGAGLTTATATATTGSLSANPPVMAFNIDSASATTSPVTATNEGYGAACGAAASSFYELFRNGQPFDLAGLVLTPDNNIAPDHYTVSTNAAPFDATKVNPTPNSIGDDSVVTHALGFTFKFPGGTTTTVRPCTNGFVWLAAATSADYTPSVADLLGVTPAPARLVPYWTDLECSRNTATHPNSGLHVLTDTSGGAGNAVCYVTWLDCGLFNSMLGTGVGGHAVVDMQCVLYEATGVVEYRYGTMPPFAQSFTGSLLVGWSRGLVGLMPSVDPQSRDLSLEAPFATAPEGAFGNIGQRIVATPDAGGEPYGARAYAGQTLTFDAVGVPVGSVIGVQLLDLAATRPGLNIPTIHAPGCLQAVSMGVLLHDVHLFPAGTVVGAAPLPIPAGVEGTDLFAQYAVLDGLLGGPDLVTRFSNAVRIRVGRN